MNFLKLLKKILIDSQLFVSLMGTLLAVFFMLEQNAFRFPTVLLIFITYFSGYLYTKYQNEKFFLKILMLNFVAGLFSALLIIYNHHFERLLKWGFLILLGLLYNSSFLTRQVRKIPLFKVFYVGLVWALVNSWLSFPYFNYAFFVVSFLFVSALVFPFDIRDMESDTVITFPRLIGVQKTKYLAYTLIFIANIFGISYLKTDFALAFYITSVLTFIFIYFSEKNRPDLYFSFGVESCSCFPFLILLLLKYF